MAGLQNDIVASTVTIGKSLRIPLAYNISTTPIQTEGSVVFEATTDTPYISNGLVWLTMISPPLVGGTGISVVGNVISTTTTITSLGAGTPLVGGANPNFTIKSLVAGTNINFTGSTANEVHINSTAASGVSQIIAGAGIGVSPGGGTGNVTVSNTGVTGLVAGSGISLSGATGNVTITATGSGGVTQIIAGTNVTISPVGGTGAVTINSTGGGAGVTQIIPGTGITVSPVGGTGNVTVSQSPGVGCFGYVSADVAITKLAGIPLVFNPFPGWFFGVTAGATSVTIVQSGLYNCQFHIGTDSDDLIGFLRVNGNAVMSGNQTSPNGEGSACGGGYLSLSGGDVVDISVDGSTANPVTVRSDTNTTGFNYPYATYLSIFLSR